MFFKSMTSLVCENIIFRDFDWYLEIYKFNFIKFYTNAHQKGSQFVTLTILKYPRCSHYMLKDNLLLEWRTGLLVLFLNFTLGAEGMRLGSVGSIIYMEHIPDQGTFIYGKNPENSERALPHMNIKRFWKTEKMIGREEWLPKLLNI